MAAFSVSSASFHAECSSTVNDQQCTLENTKITAQRTKIIPCKDSEDYTHQRKPRIQRQASLPNLNNLNRITEKELLKKKSGHLWKCVQSSPNRLGGRILRFRLRDPFDNVTPHDWSLKKERYQRANDAITAIHPAVEITGDYFLAWDPNIRNKLPLWIDTIHSTKDNYSTREESNFSLSIMDRYRRERYLASITRISDYIPIMHELGFKSDLRTVSKGSKKTGMYVEIPDRDALEANWEDLRSLNPQIPPLDIILSEGIADDIGFTMGFLIHDGVYSDGIEGFHDAFLHIFPIILLALKAGISKPNLSEGSDSDKKMFSIIRDRSFSRLKFLYTKMILVGYRRIMLIERELENPTLSIPAALRSLLKHHMNKFKGALGAVTDITSNAATMEEHISLIHYDRTNFFNQKLERIWSVSNWKNNWQKKFPDEVLDFNQLFSLWSRMEIIEKMLDSKRITKVLTEALTNNAISGKTIKTVLNKAFEHINKPLHKKTNQNTSWLIEREIFSLMRKLAEKTDTPQTHLDDLSNFEADVRCYPHTEIDSALDLPLTF